MLIIKTKPKNKNADQTRKISLSLFLPWSPFCDCYFILDLNENVRLQAQTKYILFDSKFIPRDLLLLFLYCVRAYGLQALFSDNIYSTMRVWVYTDHYDLGRPYRQLPFQRLILFALYRASAIAIALLRLLPLSFIHSFHWFDNKTKCQWNRLSFAVVVCYYFVFIFRVRSSRIRVNWNGVRYCWWCVARILTFKCISLNYSPFPFDTCWYHRAQSNSSSNHMHTTQNASERELCCLCFALPMNDVHLVVAMFVSCFNILFWIDCLLFCFVSCLFSISILYWSLLGTCKRIISTAEKPNHTWMGRFLRLNGGTGGRKMRVFCHCGSEQGNALLSTALHQSHSSV